MSAIDDMLARARERIEPRAVASELRARAGAGALVIDIRPVEQRRRDGELAGAIVIDRNVLEWRLDPTSESRISETGIGREVVLVCDEGYQSSLAAAALRELGLRATDLVGGYQAWRRSRPMP